MELMDRRVQRTEAALEQGSSHISPLPSISQSQHVVTTASNSNATVSNSNATVSNSNATVSNSNATEANVDQSVVPSIELE